MADHYYTKTPTSDHKPGEIHYDYRGRSLTFETDSGVFSRTEIDKGSDLLLSALPEALNGKVLDMGCGYGVIGVCVGKCCPEARLTLSDINERACGLARENAKRNGVQLQVLESDGYAQVPDGRWSAILQNPPIRAGKAVIYGMFAQAARRLEKDGALWLVIRKQQGAASAVAYLNTLFASVEIVLKKGGYWVLKSAKPKENTKGDTPHDL